MDISGSIKKWRKTKGITLDELGEKCGVSRSMLSQIERGEKNPTIQTVAKIAKGLEVSISKLIGEHDETNVKIIKKTEQFLFKDPKSGFERHLLSPSFSTSGIEFILNIIPAHEESGAFPPHKEGVEEYIYVLQGKLEIILNEDKKYNIESGDALFFNANKTHRFVNHFDEPCYYFLVIHSS